MRANKTSWLDQCLSSLFLKVLIALLSTTSSGLPAPVGTLLDWIGFHSHTLTRPHIDILGQHIDLTYYYFQQTVKSCIVPRVWLVDCAQLNSSCGTCIDNPSVRLQFFSLLVDKHWLLSLSVFRKKLYLIVWWKRHIHVCHGLVVVRMLDL